MDGIYKPVSLFDFFNRILDGREDALQPFIDLLDQERNESIETSLTDNQKSQSSSTENDNGSEDDNEDSSDENDDKDLLTKKNKNNEIKSIATSTRKRQRSPRKTPESSSTKRAKTTTTRLTISLNKKNYKADKQTVEDTISAMENFLTKNTNKELSIKSIYLPKKQDVL